GMFAFDFFLYAHGLLFQRIDIYAWMARGFIASVTAPLVAVTAARNPQWSVNVYVSKRMLMRSTTVLLAAAYLLLAAAAGYYVSLVGGSWGAVLQNVLIFAAVLLGVALLLSRQTREKLALFLTTNFYQNKYEYGEEWIKFSDRLGRVTNNTELPDQTLAAICDLIQAPGGALWLRDEGNTFTLASSKNLSSAPDGFTLEPGTLARFEAAGVAIELDDSAGFVIPEQIFSIYDAWLLVPLLHQGRLVGLLVMTRSLTSSSFGEEDRNLLRAVARQAAGYLALLQATEELTESRQFEAYNRFSAFLVHDLKNVIGQLSMVSANAALHRSSPDFVDDALTTIGNATEKMKRVLQQLRERSAEQRSASRVDVASVLQAVVERRSVDRPLPTLTLHARPSIYADADRFDSVVSHFVQNAQEATPPDGHVSLSVHQDGEDCVITIADDGCGMTAEFIRNRLFKPFQTTKGNAGMGIGVYEGREFARALGGNVEATSEPGHGTVIQVRLPAEVARQDEAMVQSRHA
ncbi:MAG: XrtA/PEP-CTERM system histidine kinase PrsK, partial [Pseudomonadota bacterium]|nr:XrtA/PEP-CTERM system histidine kinase PrsK [Pseudomonadota bacterium]